jgi:hypothetical protein
LSIFWLSKKLIGLFARLGTTNSYCFLGCKRLFKGGAGLPKADLNLLDSIEICITAGPSILGFFLPFFPGFRT